MASIHETAEGLHAAGVMDKRTMREFDELCLTPVRPLKPGEIRALRLREGASQAVFARYLNVTTGLVSQWERGDKHPRGASLKLLSLIAKNGLQAVACASEFATAPQRSDSFASACRERSGQIQGVAEKVAQLGFDSLLHSAEHGSDIFMKVRGHRWIAFSPRVRVRRYCAAIGRVLRQRESKKYRSV
jgi:putative transcriptional regulator